MGRYIHLGKDDAAHRTSSGWYEIVGEKHGFYILVDHRNNSHVQLIRDDDFIVEAESFEKLQWKQTDLLDETKATGWLSPNGDWYPCANDNLRAFAKYIVKMGARTLQSKGWIRLFSQDGAIEYFDAMGCTVQQGRVLIARGFCEDQISKSARKHHLMETLHALDE